MIQLNGFIVTLNNSIWLRKLTGTSKGNDHNCLSFLSTLLSKSGLLANTYIWNPKKKWF